MSDSSYSRRNFFVRAGQVGCALTVLGPGIGRGLLAETTADTAALANGILPSRAAIDPDAFSGLQWRMLGPFRGGRCAAASGVPGRPNEFYFGAVNGGVWKTIDAGRVWTPVFDSQPVASIGAIAVAPSAPDTVYVGSGESTLRDSMGYGNGMYKSTDAGKTWTHIGLDDTQHIGKIAVDPKNPNVVFVAAIGHLYAAEPGARRLPLDATAARRGRRCLFKNDNVGAVEVVIDPTNSQRRLRRAVEYAAAALVHLRADERPGRRHLQVDRRRQHVEAADERTADGGHRHAPASRSRRAIRGASTRSSTVCVPEPGARRAAAGCAGGGRGGAAAPSPQQGGFFRSDDAGATWTRLSRDQALWGRGWYFEKVAVDPKNADIVYVPNVAVSRSMDGGKTWVRAARLARRRRLPPGVGLARRSEHDDRRERPGHDHHAQRARPTIRAT